MRKENTMGQIEDVRSSRKRGARRSTMSSDKNRLENSLIWAGDIAILRRYKYNTSYLYKWSTFRI